MTEAVIVYAIVALVALSALFYLVEPGDDLTTMAAVCVLAAIWPFLLLGLGIAAVVGFKARVR